MKKSIKLKFYIKNLENIYMLGISSTLEELRMVLSLNEYLHISLQRNMNIRNFTSTPSQGFQTFSFVKNLDEDLYQRYVLLVNKYEGYSLFFSQPKFNYLLVLMGAFSSHELIQTEKLIRKINEVNAVLPIDVNTLNEKDKELLLLLE